MKVLMVCLGNICRSPLAEGTLRRKVEEKDLNWQIDSAGTGSWHVGELPDSRSIHVAAKYGIDLTTQRARQFKKNDLDNFDLIFAMDSSNYQNILKLADNQTQKNKVKLIMNEPIQVATRLFQTLIGMTMVLKKFTSCWKKQAQKSLKTTILKAYLAVRQIYLFYFSSFLSPKKGFL